MSPWIPVGIGVGVHAFIAGMVYGALTANVRALKERLDRTDDWQLQAATLMRHYAERLATAETALKLPRRAHDIN